MSEVDSWKST